MQFGGNWTKRKLECLKEYIMGYEKVMKNQSFRLLYIDAFAGSGYRTIKDSESNIKEFLKGSPSVVLENTQSFDKYIFVEKDKKIFDELKKLENQFSSKTITFENKDANVYIKKLCQKTNWNNHRAILFLDPFAMEVGWETIQSIAKTEAIDIWFLFPAMAVNRLLCKSKKIPKNWSDKLNRVFGTEEWKEKFYQKSQQMSLFNGDPESEKTASFETIKNFYLEKLKTVFGGVADNPLPLKNSKDSILFYLCFAVSNPNPKPKQIALRVAQHILGKN